MFGFGKEHEWPGVAKLCEESGEVVQEIGKLMMIGGETNHWSGDLRERLLNEMADAFAANMFVREHCFTHDEQWRFYTRVLEKRKKFAKWHEQGKDHENDRPVLS